MILGPVLINKTIRSNQQEDHGKNNNGPSESFPFENTVIPVKIEQEAGYYKSVVHPKIIRRKGVSHYIAGYFDEQGVPEKIEEIFFIGFGILSVSYCTDNCSQQFQEERNEKKILYVHFSYRSLGGRPPWEKFMAFKLSRTSFSMGIGKNPCFKGFGSAWAVGTRKIVANPGSG